jgi:hypothetical protein
MRKGGHWVKYYHVFKRDWKSIKFTACPKKKIEIGCPKVPHLLIPSNKIINLGHPLDLHTNITEMHS